MTYVASEPVEKTVFFDAMARAHETRDSAIEANFTIDLEAACETSARASMCDPAPSDELGEFLRYFCEHHPEMIRVIMGERDAT